VESRDQSLVFITLTNANGDKDQRRLNKDIVVHGPRDVLERKIAAHPLRNADGLDSRLPLNNVMVAHGFLLERVQEERSVAHSRRLVMHPNARFIPRNADLLDQLLLLSSKTDVNGFIKNIMSSVQREDNAAKLKNHVNIKLEKSQNVPPRNQSVDGHPRLEFVTTVFGKLFQDVTRRFQ